MHACSTLSLPAEIVLTTATLSPSRHHHQTWRWRAWSPYSTVASRRQSRAACVTVQAPFIAFLCEITITPLQFSCSGKAPVLRAVSLSMSIAGKKIVVNVFYAARLRRSLSNDVPEHFFFFFSFPKFFTIKSKLVNNQRGCHGPVVRAGPGRGP